MIRIVDVAQPRLGPEVVDREEKYHVIRHLHGMTKKIADLAPGRIRYDPIDGLIPIKEVAAAFDLAPDDFRFF